MLVHLGHKRSGGKYPPHAGGDLCRHLEELRVMGAEDGDLHAVIDAFERIGSRNGQAATAGEGEVHDDPMQRALAIAAAYSNAVETFAEGARGKSIIVAGEFPPHVLEPLLRDGLTLTQLHPPSPHGDRPPHFHHLRTEGFRGVCSLAELDGKDYDMVLFHGHQKDGTLLVSPLVPIVFRLFPQAEHHLLEAEHVAPHMLIGIPDDNHSRLPF